MMIVTIWEVILWNEPENLWSLSRPLLPLILLDQAFFQQYVEALCSEQPVARQASFRNVILITLKIGIFVSYGRSGILSQHKES
jgi:uncharacterized membrane protein YbaN (DUF454 family)